MTYDESMMFQALQLNMELRVPSGCGSAFIFTELHIVNSMDSYVDLEWEKFSSYDIPEKLFWYGSSFFPRFDKASGKR